MDLHEYQVKALRTAAALPEDERLLNAALGLAGEAGEFADAVKKSRHQGHPFDPDKLIEEAGDALWYLAQAAHALGISLDDIAAANLTKLSARYPEGFAAERSMYRASE